MSEAERFLRGSVVAAQVGKLTYQTPEAAQRLIVNLATQSLNHAGWTDASGDTAKHRELRRRFPTRSWDLARSLAICASRQGLLGFLSSHSAFAATDHADRRPKELRLEVYLMLARQVPITRPRSFAAESVWSGTYVTALALQ